MTKLLLMWTLVAPAGPVEMSQTIGVPLDVPLAVTLEQASGVGCTVEVLYHGDLEVLTTTCDDGWDVIGVEVVEAEPQPLAWCQACCMRSGQRVCATCYPDGDCDCETGRDIETCERWCKECCDGYCVGVGVLCDRDQGACL